MIADIIIRKITGEISKEEEKFLKNWILQDDENFLTFQRLKRMHDQNIPLPNLDHLDAGEAWKNILRQNKAKQFVPFQISRSILKYAAVFIGLFGCFLIYNLQLEKNEPIIKIDEQAITLDLGDGNIQVITEEGNTKIVNGEGLVLGDKNGGVVDYSQDSKSLQNEEEVYNTLTVPNGKTFKIVLSDGTAVNLNSGSSLKYPVKFTNEKKYRRVALVGEAYFDVTKNVEKPFIVTTDEIDIKVLGTSFNVSSYPEDVTKSTVLVEGSVRIYERGTKYKEANSTLLVPGQKADYHSGNQQIHLEQVNTELYTGWINGRLMMKEMPFTNIVKKLQRHFNITITSEFNELNSRVFTATFEDETIEEVLETFKLETPFEYEIQGNHITIKKQPKIEKPMGKV